MATTSIEWCDKVWNCVIGCTQISRGCRNCYAMRMAHRFSGKGQPYEGLTHVAGSCGPVWNRKARFEVSKLCLPLQWKKPARVFVCSMGDPFHEDITNDQIAAMFGVMAACPQHTFLLLTKRPERMLEWFGWLGRPDGDGSYPLHRDVVRRHLATYKVDAPYAPTIEWPLPNVWIGVSVENQKCADERISYLLQTPAAWHWVSCEPLIGPVDIREHLGQFDDNRERGIDWVVCGCESGRGARPMDLDWARSLREQCVKSVVPYFLKQAVVDGKLVKMPELDGKVWAQMPAVKW